MIFLSLNLLTSSDPSCKNFIYLVYIFLGKKYCPIIQYNAISVGRWWKYITDYICLFHRHLPREVDPLVYNMSMEDPGDISYSQVGGLGDQIRELREVSQSCPRWHEFLVTPMPHSDWLIKCIKDCDHDTLRCQDFTFWHLICKNQKEITQIMALRLCIVRRSNSILMNYWKKTVYYDYMHINWCIYI